MSKPQISPSTTATGSAPAEKASWGGFLEKAKEFGSKFTGAKKRNVNKWNKDTIPPLKLDPPTVLAPEPDNEGDDFVVPPIDVETSESMTAEERELARQQATAARVYVSNLDCQLICSGKPLLWRARIWSTRKFFIFGKMNGIHRCATDLSLRTTGRMPILKTEWPQLTKTP